MSLAKVMDISLLFLRRVLVWVTGAKAREQAAVVLTFLALFSLMFSYYLIKPLREALYFREFTTDFLPIFHLSVIASSIVLTQGFNYFFDRLDKKLLLQRTFYAVIVVHLSFNLFLSFSVKSVVFLFCLWASIYFLLCLALLWGVTNSRFTSSQSKRTYAFIWLGATFGALAGSGVAYSLFKFGYWQLNLSASCLFLLISLSLLRAAGRKMPDSLPQKKPVLANVETSTNLSGNETGFMRKILELARNPYLASIAILVASVTFSRSILNYATNEVVETSLASTAFEVNFADGVGDQTPEFKQFVLSLKTTSYAERKTRVDEYLKATTTSMQSEEFLESYEVYTLGLQDQTGTFFAQIYYYQNILGVFLLLVCKGTLVRVMGMRGLILLLPLIYLLFTSFLFFPIEVLFVQGFKILAGSVDYSLNNTAKELLYVPLDLEANLRFKPMIEGPIFKIGSACAALTKLAIDHTGALILGFGSYEILLVFVLAVVCFWIYRANVLASDFLRLTHS
jgi:ATP/ADP translocase